MLVHLEVEHHLQAFTSGAEVFHVGTWKHVRFGQDDCFSFSPGQKLAEGSQHIVLLFCSGHLCSLLRNDKWNGVHAKAGDSELQPKAHDLEDLSLNFRIGSIEVRLKIIKAMEVVGLGNLVVVPGRLLYTGEHYSGGSILRLVLGPHIPVTILGLRIATGGLEPGMFVGGVIDHQVNQHAQSPLFAATSELDKVSKGPIARVDAVIVCDIIAVVLIRRRLKRHKPYRSNAQSLEIIQAAHQTL